MSEHQETQQHEGHAHDDGGSPDGGAGGIDAASAWDERYRSKARLRPGKALELGCGEGADAIWLAQQGWSVTAVDVSAVALERARSHELAELARESVHASNGTMESRIT